MRIVLDHNDAVASFVAQMVPHCARGFGPCQTLGIIDNDGKLVAGLVYHNYDPEAQIIEISGAATTARWLQPNVINAMFDYPFVGLHCQMVVMRVRADNERLLRQLAWYNFTFHRMPRLFGRDKDGVVCTLTDDEWSSNLWNMKRFAKMKEAA